MTREITLTLDICPKCNLPCGCTTKTDDTDEQARPIAGILGLFPEAKLCKCGEQ